MNKSISLALFVVGIILIIAGFTAADSVSSSFSRFFTGNPTDKSMWLLLGGLAAVIIGGVGFGRGGNNA